MKKVGFIGAFDKTDVIIYLAKVLTTVGKKILVIDSTLTQKAKYVVPVINPTTSYITEFEEIDVAVGFEDFDSIRAYLGVSQTEDLPYDYALIDIDNPKSIYNFNMQEAEKNYFVTSFDLYSLKKGLEILCNLTTPINMTKVLFSKEMSKEEDDYLNFLSLNYKVMWADYRIYFPLENGDASIIAENQRVEKIRLKKISAQYKESLLLLAEEILKDVSSSMLRKALKTIEKGV